VVLSKEVKVVQVHLFGDIETVLSVQELNNGISKQVQADDYHKLAKEDVTTWHKDAMKAVRKTGMLGNGDVVLSKEVKVVQVHLFGDIETVLSVQELNPSR
jgi:poly-gamma-glutamate capsule biosynthesis protein CapA/YwtB (metallophosphatase superfamily)